MRLGSFHVTYKFKETEFFKNKIISFLESERTIKTDLIEVFYYSNAFVNSFMGLINFFEIIKSYDQKYFLGNKKKYVEMYESLKNENVVKFYDHLRDRLFHQKPGIPNIILKIPVGQIDFNFDFSILKNDKVEKNNPENINGVKLIELGYKTLNGYFSDLIKLIS